MSKAGPAMSAAKVAADRRADRSRGGVVEFGRFAEFAEFAMITRFAGGFRRPIESALITLIYTPYTHLSWEFWILT